MARAADGKVVMHRHLPPEGASDWHQIIAKALHYRYVHGIRGPFGASLAEVRFSREELERAMDAEFEYGLDDDGALLFRPVQP